jgi:uncharacterized protein YndB with AHSA1/START domain
MANPDALLDSETSLAMTRTLDAPREAVFAAFTDPTQFQQWMGPGTMRAEVERLEPRVGGAYRVVMRDEQSNAHIVSGIYREVAAPSRLVFTWAWEMDAATRSTGHESLVTVTFRALGNRTELTLRHEKLESAASRDQHSHGWEGVFPKLEKFLAGRTGRA